MHQWLQKHLLKCRLADLKFNRACPEFSETFKTSKDFTNANNIHSLSNYYHSHQ